MKMNVMGVKEYVAPEIKVCEVVQSAQLLGSSPIEEVRSGKDSVHGTQDYDDEEETLDW